MSAVAANGSGLDVEQIRRDFPVLDQQVRGRRLAYLDNAATTQKPLAVLEAVDHYYRHDNANVHRGLHTLAERATERYESARDRLARRTLSPQTHTQGHQGSRVPRSPLLKTLSACAPGRNNACLMFACAV